MTNSQHPQSPSSSHYRTSCGSCGHAFIAKSGAACPSCGGQGFTNEEVTKKTFDAPDLKKGF